MQNRCGQITATVAAVAFVQLATVAWAGDGVIARDPEGPVPAVLGADFQMTVGDRVFFGEGSAKLGTRARAALQAQAQWLVRHPWVFITLEGHADDHGGDDLLLSQDRAEAVRQRLIEDGVEPLRIKTQAFGRSRSVADCANTTCAAQNRRVVTRVGEPQPDRAPDLDLAVRRDDATLRRTPRQLF
jgi:outer membrane protein OmpA-like peptidoglycan-associated protein